MKSNITQAGDLQRLLNGLAIRLNRLHTLLEAADLSLEMGDASEKNLDNLSNLIRVAIDQSMLGQAALEEAEVAAATLRIRLEVKPPPAISFPERSQPRARDLDIRRRPT